MIALMLVMLGSFSIAFVVVPKHPSRLFPLCAKSNNHKEEDSTTVQHNNNPSFVSSNNNTGGVKYLNDFTFLTDTQGDQNAPCFHPTVKLLDTLIDGSIVEARQLEFVRIRSMSPRQLKVWKVTEEHHDPVDVCAVFTPATLSNHGKKFTTITGHNPSEQHTLQYTI